jgi:UDP-2-acetamido-3-amino-2,3-dideoxy-glucuronate N-acetyltransferase
VAGTAARPGPGAPGVAVIGCGRWGVNLVRNFHGLGALRAIHDVDPTAADQVSRKYDVPAAGLEEVLADPCVDAVVVSAPARHHLSLARRALAADKHVMVEKPLALDVAGAEELCRTAEERGLVLMVGHLLQYHPAFLALKELVDDGTLGRVRYLYSNRLNLGRIRREEDILWSFAPHDISMILTLVGTEPETVTATGGDYLSEGIADVTTTHLTFPGGERAHVFVSWLHPYKEQRLVVAGEKGMAVFDDGEPWGSKLCLFRHAIAWNGGVPEPVRAEPEVMPVEPNEPLEAECRHFLSCVASGVRPRTDGREGLRVLRVLDRAARSMGAGARMAPLPEHGPDRPVVHESAYVDEPVQIGAGTRIWHFSHVLAGTTIGRDCVIGQNVMIGPDVTVGDRCRIQNNVSVYKGVTLEDEVFCGPACVFTNVVHPRAGIDRKDEFVPTRVGRGATIGANATIVCGNSIGAWSFVAAGAVVTSDVPPHALVAGVPARRIGWVSHDGERLGDDLVCPRSGRRYVLTGEDRLQEVVDD